MTGRHVVGRKVKRPPICKAIRRAREGTDVSQSDLARSLGVAQSTLARWENFAEPSLSVINEIERRLRLAKGDILRSAGHVDGEFMSVWRVVEVDPSLDERARHVMLATYRSLLNGKGPR